MSPALTQSLMQAAARKQRPALPMNAAGGPALRSTPRSLAPAIQRKAACACGGGCPKCAEPLTVALTGGAPQAASSMPAAPEPDLAQPAAADEAPIPSSSDAQQSNAPADDGDAEPLDSNAACPVNAVFSANVAGGGSKANCQVPQGQSGAARLAQYLVHGVSPIPASGLSIDERFAVIEDPYSIAGALSPAGMTTDGSGRFDDCYRLASKNALPPDFRLKVAQNHLYGGQPISKNIITYTANGVDVRHCKRKPGSCDFSDVCRL